jgi:hypothetical protein
MNFNFGSKQKEGLGAINYEELIRKNNYVPILRLIDSGYLKLSDLEKLFSLIDSDEFLYDLSLRIKNDHEAQYLFKFIANKKIFSRIVEENGKSFTKLSKQMQENVAVLAKKFFNVLSNDPEIHQFGELIEGDHNKFVIGVPEVKDVLFIAWSNTKKHGNHGDIFDFIHKNFDHGFSLDLRSGGKIKIEQDEKNKINVTLHGHSLSFGNYSNRVLKLFEEKILRVLKEKLGSQNIELKIEVSS